MKQGTLFHRILWLDSAAFFFSLLHSAGSAVNRNTKEKERRGQTNEYAATAACSHSLVCVFVFLRKRGVVPVPGS